MELRWPDPLAAPGATDHESVSDLDPQDCCGSDSGGDPSPHLVDQPTPHLRGLGQVVQPGSGTTGARARFSTNGDTARQSSLLQCFPAGADLPPHGAATGKPRVLNPWGTPESTLASDAAEKFARIIEIGRSGVESGGRFPAGLPGNFCSGVEYPETAIARRTLPPRNFWPAWSGFSWPWKPPPTSVFWPR